MYLQMARVTRNAGHEGVRSTLARLMVFPESPRPTWESVYIRLELHVFLSPRPFLQVLSDSSSKSLPTWVVVPSPFQLVNPHIFI